MCVKAATCEKSCESLFSQGNDMNKAIAINEITISPCETFHLHRDLPLYSHRFNKVLKFHEPGLAPVISESGAYHINIQGESVYPSRFFRTFGFYQSLATVIDEKGWFHIRPDGSSITAARYAWCGNFQNNACVVKDFNNNFFHIDHAGNRLYTTHYQYAGDFRDDIAVIQNNQGLYTHITKQGHYLHPQWFLDLDIYHKGFARAKDEHGWFHIDGQGYAVYPERYAMIEPFYNGYARVTTTTGAILRINEKGHVTEQLLEPTMTEFQQLSSDIVGFWRTQTIKAAVELEVFDNLPASVELLSEAIAVSPTNTRRLLRALQELNLIYRQEQTFYPTTRAAFLSAKHPLSLNTAVKHWGEAHYLIWMHLAKSLQDEQAAYAKHFNQPLFDWLDADPLRLATYQQAMAAYARHDYQHLSHLLDFKGFHRVIDAAGGTGSLLHYILEDNPHVQGILLERPSVAQAIMIPPALQPRMQVQGFDLFSPWPAAQADAILLARVLHDWDDEPSLAILKHAYQALRAKGRLTIIEFLLAQQHCGGGMLDMNMLVVTGGKERSLEEFQILASTAGFNYVAKQSYGAYHMLHFTKSTDV
jgi:predicted transcriptional regulator